MSGYDSLMSVTVGGCLDPHYIVLKKAGSLIPTIEVKCKCCKSIFEIESVWEQEFYKGDCYNCSNHYIMEVKF